MSRLLSANFMRLKYSKVFWICVAAMAGFAAVMQWFNYRDIKDGAEVILEGDLLVFVPFVSIAAGAFASLFLGTEYSDGTIRNKVVIGHRRVDIYLSNLITTAAAAIIMCAAYLIVYSLIGAAVIGSFTAKPLAILTQILCVMVLSAAFAALFTLLAMNNQNKAVSAVLCVLLAFALLLAGSYLNARLEEPEYTGGYYMDESGQLQKEEPYKNPRYLEGSERKAYQFAYDFLPSGQQIQLGSGGSPHPWRLMGYSAVVTIVTTAAGILIFRRKNLR